MRAIEAGDEEEWGSLVRRLQRIVRGRLNQFNVDDEVKNDAEAETWRTLYEQLGTVRNPEALVGWIGVVARSKMIDVIRRQGATERSIPYEDAAATIGHHDDDALVDEETKAVLRRAVARLSAREQAVVNGRLLCDEPTSLRSMGDVLDIPVGSIGPTLGRSLKKLRHDAELVRYLELNELNQRAAA